MISNEYDDNERLVAKTDAIGNRTVFSYDANHNVISICGPKEDQHKEIVYDKANQPIQILDKQTDISKLITKKKYNKLGQVISEVNPCGHETKFAYDHLGRIVAVYHPDGAIERKEYDILGNVTKEIDALGYVVVKTYNFRGQPLTIQHPDGSQESFTYYPSGTLKSSVDKNGMTTTFTYDIFNNVIKTESLKTTTATYTPFAKISETDGEGITTFYEYDFIGRKMREKRDYRDIQYSYDSLGRLSKIQEGNITVVEEFNALNQTIKKETFNGISIQTHEEYKYDKAGNVAHVINAKGTTETVFNSFGQPISIRDALGFVTYISYSYLGNFVQTITNPKGIQTVTSHDSRGRINECLKKNTKGEVIQKSENHYDKNGNPVQQTHTIFSGISPIKTITHSWSYGPMNRLERLLEAGEKETRHFYDAKGRLKTKVKADGISLNHEYDPRGRLSRYFSEDFDYHYTYDNNDQVISVYDQLKGNVTTRHYDALGNVIQERLANQLVFKNSYDARGKRTEFTLPDDTKIQYVYDGIYLHSVQRKGQSCSYHRDSEGEIIEIVLPRTAGSISIERDALGRYKKVRSSYYNADYPDSAYDSLGNLCQYQYRDGIGIENCHYDYDDLEQLTSENAHSYESDSLNNRLKKDNLNHIINNLCQITNDGKQDYSYDQCGNLIWDGKRHYSYDSQDRLIKIQEDGAQIEYAYDCFHRRIQKKISGKSISYMWDGDNEIGTVDEQGKITELRVLGEGLGAEIGAAVLFEIKEKSYIPIHDHRGCVVVLVDLENKIIKENYRYDAYGEETTGNHFSPWRFSSKRVDESGLIFFGRRYYHPSLGRWITQDPQGFEDGPNLYAYVHNNPILHFDLYGLKDARGLFNFGYSFLEEHNWGRARRVYHCNHLMPNFEIRYREKSSAFSLSSAGYSNLSSPFYAAPIFVNGMLNNKGNCIGSGKNLSDTLGGIDINLIHNASHGKVDFYEARLNVYQGKMTDPCFQLRDKIYEIFSNAPENYKQLIYCHSQGTAIVRNFLIHCPKYMRDRIVVCAIAPSAYIPSHLCHKVFHGVSKRDVVPWLDLKGRKHCKDTTTILTPHKDAKWLDHDFNSKTYTEYMQYVFEYYNKL